MKSLSLLVGVCLAVAARAQQFQNLDFEQAKTQSSIYTWDALVGSLFPGWTLYPRIRNSGPGGLDSPIPGYNSICLGSPCIDIYGPPRGAFDPVVQAEHGKFSVLVDSGGGLSGGRYELGLEQVGLIPSNSKTLLWSATDKALLRIDGTSLDPVLVGEGTRYPTWGVDVGSWAGSVVDLKIGASGTFSQFSGGSYLRLDYLRFSEAALVPEPAPFALTALGVAALVWARRRSFPR